MPSASKYLTSDQLDWIDERVKRFEDRRRSSPDTCFEDYLSKESNLNHLLLIELIHSDLEFRIRRELPVDIASYLNRFPEIADDSNAVAELLISEHSLRNTGTAEDSIAAILEKYPHLRDNLPNNWKSESLAKPHEAKHPALPGFQIIERIGQDGMGVVYRAIDDNLGREVAIKLMIQGGLASPRQQRRFIREAQIVSAMQHPNILPLLHFGFDQGQPYLVLEYVPDGSLSKRLASSMIPPRQAAELLIKVCSGIEALHQAGVVHRDLKPSNILLTRDGTPKICDFGLAKQFKDDPNQTDSQDLMGTPSYKAPECLFEVNSTSTPSADIYSLGAILYEMLTGRAPYVGSSLIEILRQVKQGSLVCPRALVPSISIDLENICLKCLDIPNRRYASAKDLAADLQRYLDRKVVSARPRGRFFKLIQWSRRNLAVAGLSVALATCLILVTAGSTWIAWRESISNQIQFDLRRKADAQRQVAELHQLNATSQANASVEALEFIQEIFDVAENRFSQRFNVDDDFERFIVDVPAQQLVERGIQKLGSRFEDHPVLRARLLSSLGILAFHAGMLHQSRLLLEEAIAIFESSDVGPSMMMARDYMTLGRIEADRWNFGTGKKLFLRALAIANEVDNADSIFAYELHTYRTWLAVRWNSKIDLEPLISGSIVASQTLSDRLGRDHPIALFSHVVTTIGQGIIENNLAKATSELENIWSDLEHRPIHPYYKAFILNQLASLNQRMNKTQSALDFTEKSLAWQELALGDTPHPLSIEIFSDTAWILHCQGAEKRSIEFEQRAVEMRLSVTDFDLVSQKLVGELAHRMHDAGKSTALCQLYKETSVIGPWHPWQKIGIDLNYAKEQLQFGNYFEIPKIVGGHLLKGEGEPDRRGKEAYSSLLSLSLALQGEFNRAEEINAHIVEYLQTKSGPQWSFIIDNIQAVSKLGGAPIVSLIEPPSLQVFNESQTDLAAFHPDDWHRIIDRCYQVAEQTPQSTLLSSAKGWCFDRNPRHPVIGAVYVALAKRQLVDGEVIQALDSCKKGIAILVESLGEHTRQTQDARTILADLQRHAGDLLGAQRTTIESIAHLQEFRGKWHEATVEARIKLCELHQQIGETTIATELAEELLATTRSTFGQYHPVFVKAAICKTKLLQVKSGRDCAAEFLSPIVAQIKNQVPTNGLVRLMAESALAELESQ